MLKQFNLKHTVIALGTSFILSMAVIPIVSASSLQKENFYIGPTQAVVSYADLNLENEEDVQVLYQRLEYASKITCGIDLKRIYGTSVYLKRESQRCYRATLSDSIDKFDNDDLTRIHTG